MSHEHSEIAGRVDFGPEGCELDWLTSARLEVDDDPVAFQKLATDAESSIGLPASSRRSSPDRYALAISS